MLILPKTTRAFTRTELLVALGIGVILIAAAIPFFKRSSSYRSESALNSARQLYIAAFSMATDFGTVRPYGNRGFVVFRKGGDGSEIAGADEAKINDLSKMGLLPGRTDFESRSREMPLPLQ